MNSKEENVEKYKGLAEKLSAAQAEKPASTLESTFNIEPGSTPCFQDKVEQHLPVADTLVDPTTGEVIVREMEASTELISKEERIEDLQIDGKLNEVYDNAMTAFNSHAGVVDGADPKFAARNGEVAAQFLKIALDSTTAKVDAKYKRNKIRIAQASVGKPNQVQNNVIVADRNALLKTMFSQDHETTIEQEMKKLD